MIISYIYDLEVYPPKGGNHTHALEVSKGLSELGVNLRVLDDDSNPFAKNVSSQSANWLADLLYLVDAIIVRIDSRFISESDIIIELHREKLEVPIFWEINSPSYENLAFSWLGGKNAWNGLVKESLIRRAKRWLHARRLLSKSQKEEELRCVLARRVCGAICVSEALEVYAKSIGISNTLVIPNGGPSVSDDWLAQRQDKQNNSGQFNVLYAGSAIYPWQGLDILSDVIRLAEKQLPRIHFTLIVNGPTKDIPKFTNVTIHQRLPRDEVLEKVSNADLCVALLHDWWWSPIGFHGSPTKIFEYMAMGTPVMTSNHSQMKSLFTDNVNAILVENNPNEIVERFKILIRDKSKLVEIGNAGRELIQQELSWHQVAEKTKSFICESTETV